MVGKRPPRFHQTNRRLVHFYRGDGKGKTTAAVGVAVRARGHGWRVAFLQFMKEPKWPSGERASLKKLGVDVRVLGAGFFKIMHDRQPTRVHRAAARRALQIAARLIRSGRYDLVVLDELGTAVDVGLLTQREIEGMLWSRDRQVSVRRTHLIITGHARLPWLERRCDLVTEMRKVQHPFDRGVLAVKGLDD